MTHVSPASYRFPLQGWLLAGLLVVVTLGGCARVQQWHADRQPDFAQQMTDTQAAYDAGRYEQAYQQAARLSTTNSPHATTAAYIAGMSAVQLERLQSASRYLQVAAQSDDPQLATDAKATLGLVYARLNRHDLAARTLVEAAGRLSGQDRANAYYYAALSEQKLGRWPQARTNLTLARAHSREDTFRQRVEEQLNVTGFTIQIGAFGSEDNAQKAAADVAQQAGALRIGTPRIQQAATSEGQTMLLVQVGRFHSFFTAEMFRRRLNVNEAIIVPLSGSTTP